MSVWSFAPSISLPLFSGGSNMAKLRYAEAEKKGLIATYEKPFRAHLRMWRMRLRVVKPWTSSWMPSANTSLRNSRHLTLP
ncbi:efflux transporter, outer membrane factor (OMF) lipoprotein, NodT family [Kluyvera cryocrescens]|uniref:Efflux transporter, outer membrane factor (OMF) lipoprotein, NodT family n=1 Tax=Kluyvera cryocrescens TaxID=580 RepID=A0A485AK16_KLUCR|nr:efflux transporter, outer membrane factor (OMF) lipoprotein, NodT family [Kluyvera cryocrescens]